MPRNACVIQITPVRLTRTSTNDASVVRKIYLSIDPIATARSPHQPELRCATNPETGNPLWSRRHSSWPAHSLYHPFDLSTKWLCHGTLRIRLIIRNMWPPGHCRRLAAQPLAGHIVPDHALDGCESQPKEDIPSTARR